MIRKASASTIRPECRTDNDCNQHATTSQGQVPPCDRYSSRLRHALRRFLAVDLVVELAGELITNPWNGLDEGGAIGRIAEGLSDFANPLSQRVFNHVHVWPDCVEKLRLRNDSSPVLDQVRQQLKSSGWQVDVLRATNEASLATIQDKVAEAKGTRLVEHEILPG